MVLTGRLVALAALGVLLVPLPGAVLAGYAGLLVLGVAVDLARAGRLADLTLVRDQLPAVRLGERTVTALRVRNGGSRAVRGVLRDAWVPSAGADGSPHSLAVAPGGVQLIETPLVPARRGPRPAVRVTLRALGPLGLAGRQRRRMVPGTLRVLPAFASRRFLPEKLSRLRQLDGAVAVRQRGQGSDFDSLREYVLGDDVRSIDWRATARATEVMVRTWQPERDRQVVLALDTGRTSAARIGDEPRLDAAIDACLLLGALAAAAGDRVALLAADVTVRARLAPTGVGALPRLVDALTPVQPALVETDPQLLAGEVLRQVNQRSLVVLFTTVDVAVADSGLLPAVRALLPRHEVVVASVADPTVAALAAARDDPYTAAAAELAAAQAAQVADQLRRLGAHVVDVAADLFASRVADAYLGLKAAGRL